MRHILAWVSALATIGAAETAVFDDAHWTWTAPIKIQSDQEGFVRLAVTPEMFDQSQASLNDLRVVDDTGVLVPHIVHWARVTAAERTEWRSVQLLNPTFEPSGYARVTLDFGEPVRKNRVKINQSGENFRRRLLIDGSADNLTFETVLEEGYLFDISLPGAEKYSVDTVAFQVNDFRYLRLTVYTMADDPRRIQITSAAAALIETLPGIEPQPVPTVSGTLSFDSEKKESIYAVDVGYRNLPVVRAIVSASDAYFHRGFELRGRNSPTVRVQLKTETGWDMVEREAPWNPIARGVIYRIQEEDRMHEHVVLEGFNAPYRYFQLRISEGDNPPLAIEDVKMFRNSADVVFKAQPGHTYALVGGNPEAQAPSYDLAQTIKDLGERSLPAAVVGAVTPLSHAPRLEPWTERHRVVIWLALLLAVGVMLCLILSNLRRIRHVPLE